MKGCRGEGVNGPHPLHPFTLSPLHRFTMSDFLLDSVRSLISRTEMIQRENTVIVAVSGGQDSCALLHALVSLRDEIRFHLHAAHLNHGFRGIEAECDAEFVQRLAASLGVDCTTATED